MDFSDIIRKLQSQAVFSIAQQQFKITQPNCELGTCSAPSTCTLNFPSYEYKNLFYNGKQFCSSCTTTCG